MVFKNIDGADCIVKSSVFLRVKRNRPFRLNHILSAEICQINLSNVSNTSSTGAKGSHAHDICMREALMNSCKESATN